MINELPSRILYKTEYQPLYGHCCVVVSVLMIGHAWRELTVRPVPAVDFVWGTHANTDVYAKAIQYALERQEELGRL